MNAICSHDAKTNEVECDCLTGYTNTGSGSTFTCTGNCSQREEIVIMYFVSDKRAIGAIVGEDVVNRMPILN